MNQVVFHSHPGIEVRQNFQSTFRECYLIQVSFYGVFTFGRSICPNVVSRVGMCREDGAGAPSLVVVVVERGDGALPGRRHEALDRYQRCSTTRRAQDV